MANVISAKKIQDDSLLEEMKKDCAALVQEALRTGEFVDRTGNLASSVGAAIYHDGKLVDGTITSYDFGASKPRYWYGAAKYGQSELRNYFNNYKPRKEGYAIVLVAAMPYSEVLESGKYLTRKYRVITGAYTLMRQLAEKYQGKRGYKTRKYGQGLRVSLNEI